MDLSQLKVGQGKGPGFMIAPGPTSSKCAYGKDLEILYSFDY
jgi:hypothetical protein